MRKKQPSGCWGHMPNHMTHSSLSVPWGLENQPGAPTCSSSSNPPIIPLTKQPCYHTSLGAKVKKKKKKKKKKKEQETERERERKEGLNRVQIHCMHTCNCSHHYCRPINLQGWNNCDTSFPLSLWVT